MEKLHVLYFVDRMLRGGIQSFVLENWRHMDHSKIQVDFLLLDDGHTYELEDILRNLGSTVYKLKGIWICTIFDYLRYWKALKLFFKEHSNYQVIHLHSGSKNFLVLAVAKKYGIPVRIAHSHNIHFQTKSKIQILVGNLFKLPLRFYATDYFACSRPAGKWLFGRRIARNSLVIVKNGVDTEKFYFDQEISLFMREKLGLKEFFVIGHVGRFTHQKNHIFLIKVFQEIVRRRPNARLLLVGSGELEDEIRKVVNNFGLTEKVIFAGFHQNVQDYMQAMDVFVLPSSYAGQ